MPRAPFNVSIYPTCEVGEGEFEYAILKRADAGFWQGASGGGEDDETPLEAAKRELLEETGIPPDTKLMRLDIVGQVPATAYRDSHLWGEDLYIVPQYYFAALLDHQSLTLSSEHLECRWLGFDEAHQLLKYDDAKTALWELNQRLKGLGPRG